MAQVNQVPGQNQTFANVAVPASAPYVPTQDTRAKAIAITVPYMQSEPGKHDKNRG